MFCLVGAFLLVKEAGVFHEIMFLMTYPCTFVSRRSILLWRKESFVWLMPSRQAGSQS